MNTEIYKTEDILGVIMNLGKEMLMCGAEVNRVEDTISRLCSAYKFTKADIFSITSLILVTVSDQNGKQVSLSRRITGYVFNFYRLEELNALSRTVCRTTPSPDEFQHLLDEIILNSHFSKLFRFLGFLLASFGYCMLFQGSPLDALCSALISVLIFATDRFFHHFRINSLMYNLTVSLIAGLSAFMLCDIFPCLHADKIMIGDIMLLIPGLILTNAIKDMISGDTMAGFLRFCEAILTAVFIALGFMFSMYVMGVISW